MQDHDRRTRPRDLIQFPPHVEDLRPVTGKNATPFLNLMTRKRRQRGEAKKCNDSVRARPDRVESCTSLHVSLLKHAAKDHTSRLFEGALDGHPNRAVDKVKECASSEEETERVRIRRALLGNEGIFTWLQKLAAKLTKAVPKYHSTRMRTSAARAIISKVFSIICFLSRATLCGFFTQANAEFQWF